MCCSRGGIVAETHITVKKIHERPPGNFHERFSMSQPFSVLVPRFTSFEFVQAESCIVVTSSLRHIAKESRAWLERSGARLRAITPKTIERQDGIFL